jgi:CheY-like chemotaxis protein
MKRLLVADDNPVNQLLLRRGLEKAGYEVTVVSNGVEAVAAATREHYEAIIMDLQMPQMDGCEAIRRIRGEPGQAEVAVVALTADVTDMARDACRAAGADVILAKPADAGRVLEALDGLRANRPEPPTITHIPAGLAHLEAALRDDIIATFIQTTPALVEQLQAALTIRDSQALLKATHSLAGAVRIVDIFDVLSLVKRLDECVRALDWKAADAAQCALSAGLEQLFAGLSQSLQKA